MLLDRPEADDEQREAGLQPVLLRDEGLRGRVRPRDDDVDLVRQPGVADVTAQPFSLLGNFALEGIALSLAWLSLLVSGCVALLRGAVVFTSER